VEHARGMGKPLEATSGHGDGWSVELDGGGGSAAQVSPAFGKLAKLGSKQGGFGSGMFSVPRRTWLGPWQDTLGLGSWVRRSMRLDSSERGGLGPRDGLRALESSAI